jgi:hypothetical protein
MMAFPAMVLAQQAQAMCYASLEAYVQDRSLNARWEGSTVVLKRAGSEFVCQCASQTQPPVCKPRGSSGASGTGGVDVSRFNPGQQVALIAAQTMIQSLFNGIFSGNSSAGSAADALKAQQDMLAKQEAERQQALQSWNVFQEEEKQRLQAEQNEARSSGQKLLNQMGGASGQELNFQSLSGDKLEFNDWAARKPEASPLPPGKFPAPKTALEQARCAAYFSERARELSGPGKLEEAQFMSQQAEKAMSGGPLDAPCQTAATGGAAADAGPDSQKAGSRDLAVAVNEVLSQYNAKIKELLDLSQKLAEVRKQKIEAEYRLQEVDARITDIRNQAAAATRPEEKQKCDDLFAEALALRGQSENQLKVATENEDACLTSARQAEEAVKALGSKLQEGKEKK